MYHFLHVVLGYVDSDTSSSYMSYNSDTSSVTSEEYYVGGMNDWDEILPPSPNHNFNNHNGNNNARVYKDSDWSLRQHPSFESENNEPIARNVNRRNSLRRGSLSNTLKKVFVPKKTKLKYDAQSYQERFDALFRHSHRSDLERHRNKDPSNHREKKRQRKPRRVRDINAVTRRKEKRLKTGAFVPMSASSDELFVSAKCNPQSFEGSHKSLYLIPPSRDSAALIVENGNGPVTTHRHISTNPNNISNSITLNNNDSNNNNSLGKIPGSRSLLMASAIRDNPQSSSTPRMLHQDATLDELDSFFRSGNARFARLPHSSEDSDASNDLCAMRFPTTHIPVRMSPRKLFSGARSGEVKREIKSERICRSCNSLLVRGEQQCDQLYCNSLICRTPSPHMSSVIVEPPRSENTRSSTLSSGWQQNLSQLVKKRKTVSNPQIVYSAGVDRTNDVVIEHVPDCVADTDAESLVEEPFSSNSMIRNREPDATSNDTFCAEGSSTESAKIDLAVDIPSIDSEVSAYNMRMHVGQEPIVAYSVSSLENLSTVRPFLQVREKEPQTQNISSVNRREISSNASNCSSNVSDYMDALDVPVAAVGNLQVNLSKEKENIEDDPVDGALGKFFNPIVEFFQKSLKDNDSLHASTSHDRKDGVLSVTSKDDCLELSATNSADTLKSIVVGAISDENCNPESIKKSSNYPITAEKNTDSVHSANINETLKNCAVM